MVRHGAHDPALLENGRGGSAENVGEIRRVRSRPKRHDLVVAARGLQRDFVSVRTEGVAGGRDGVGCGRVR